MTQRCACRPARVRYFDCFSGHVFHNKGRISCQCQAFLERSRLCATGSKTGRRNVDFECLALVSEDFRGFSLRSKCQRVYIYFSNSLHFVIHWTSYHRCCLIWGVESVVKYARNRYEHSRTPVNFSIMSVFVFCVVTPRGLVSTYHQRFERTCCFHLGSSMFLQNDGIYLQVHTEFLSVRLTLASRIFGYGQ